MEPQLPLVMVMMGSRDFNAVGPLPALPALFGTVGDM